MSWPCPASQYALEMPPALCCLCVRALPAALPHMAAVLAARPPGFPSLEVACDWAVRTATCKNREMAGVSLPAQLKQVGMGCLHCEMNSCVHHRQHTLLCMIGLHEVRPCHCKCSSFWPAHVTASAKPHRLARCATCVSHLKVH